MHVFLGSLGVMLAFGDLCMPFLFVQPERHQSLAIGLSNRELLLACAIV